MSSASPFAPHPQVTAYTPASFLQPAELTEPRFASRSDGVVVHRMGSVTCVVEACQQLGPQQLLARLLAVLGIPSATRLSFPALMPVEVPCRLHVVVGSRQPATASHVQVLVDLRRVAITPTVHWCVIHLPTPCTLQDIIVAIREQCSSILPFSAAYLNF